MLEGEILVSAKAPSNIAWIKYWGKKGPQLPANASLSLTLKECATLTELKATPSHKLQVDFLFHGERNETFAQKTLKYVEALTRDIPELTQLKLEISSLNTFPHSAGIASSASSQAALALALQKLKAHLRQTELDLHETGSWARMGSGSACRSLHGGYAVWGENKLIPGSSDQYAVEVTSNVHPHFINARDCILVVSTQEKDVSSRQGHTQMEAHPYAAGRLAQVALSWSELWPAMQSGDWEKAGDILETEALSLHALMMSSTPGFVLLAPNSLEIIRLVRLFRKASGIPMYFTIDAGPNIHLIYPDSVHNKVEPFIRHELMRFTEKGSSAIWDMMGGGAT